MDELPIQRIKDLIQQDDPAALDIIYDHLGQRLYHYVLGLLGSEPEAQDVIQKLFIRLAKKRRHLLKAENMVGYLFAMARNLARDALSNRPQQTENIEDYLNVLVSDAKPPDQQEGGVEVLQALLALPFKQREVVNMKCLEAMTFEEIARSLNISLNTAASRYRYAMAKLRRKLIC
ncbi:MAG: RNA polymerase sigma factor [Verrucomicrobia bacterium]|nr:RNA polymerase sigma factor [Verrucomicrobiota bacterium]MBU1734155.1 RNA polymerase sigma factor [Verrucomicrobiota bacterium]MBU1856491.1 RNA polymerase sigma factor [Verrucomicrobiota bacterium]